MGLGEIKSHTVAAAVVALAGFLAMANAFKWTIRRIDGRSDAYLWGFVGVALAIVAAVLLGVASDKAACSRGDQKVNAEAMNKAHTQLTNALIVLVVLQGLGVGWAFMNARSWDGGVGLTFLGMVGLFVACILAVVVSADEGVQDCRD